VNAAKIMYINVMDKITGRLKRERKTFIGAKSGDEEGTKGTLNSENTVHRPVQNPLPSISYQKSIVYCARKGVWKRQFT
jgi:hypothetical protein